jgi:hypothetical protein
MIDTSVRIYGELAKWPSKDAMASILRAAGLVVTEGRFSVRVESCSHFVFQEYGGDLGDPVIDADAESAEEAIRDAQIVSNALAHADIKHHFEIYNHRDELAGDVHHNWPSLATDH